MPLARQRQAVHAIAGGGGGSSLPPIPEDAIWISTTGNDTTGAGTYANPYLSFDKARQVATSGDTIAYKNGTYTASNQRAGGTGMQPPAGTAGNLTYIRAETPGSVTIDMSGAQYGIYVTVNYVHIDGFRSINGEEFCMSLDGSNCIATNCFFGNANNTNFALHFSVTGNNNLIEDCWSCGRGRGVICYGTGHTFRRVVIRLDEYNGDQGYVGFVVYDGTNTTFENCIAIDFASSGTAFDWKGGFRSRDIFEERQHYMYGCLALNTLYDGFRLVCTEVKDCIAWDINGRGGFYEDQEYGTGETIMNCTVGDTTNGGVNLITLSDVHSTLHVNVSGGNSAGDRCHYWNTTSPGGTNVITTDPQQLYIVRVEDGTPGDGTGQGSTDRGATMVKRYVDRSLTTDNLWPWPNETRIRDDFRTDFGLTANEKRGFAADGTDAWGQAHTLTRYIWQYLGNQIPSGIY